MHLWTKIRPLIPSRRRPSSGPVVIDIGSDRRGEFFDIQATQDADVQVLEVQPKDRHLLLMVRQSAERPGLPDPKDKFLCGHDERHWFVAGVPESAPVSSVITAKEALKPELVRSLESGKRGKRAKRQRRKTETFIRQGEWFFVPAPGVSAAEKLVLRNEPLRHEHGDSVAGHGVRGLLGLICLCTSGYVGKKGEMSLCSRRITTIDRMPSF